MVDEILEIKEFGNLIVMVINGGYSSNYLSIKQKQPVEDNVITITIGELLTIANWADKISSQYS